MLIIKNLTKSFGGIRALQDLSFEIPQNQITAVIGPNGAGKTTLFDIISGLISADAGEIVYGDINLLILKPHEIANLGISRTFQQVRLFRNLTILDHLVMASSNEDTKLLRNLFPSSPRPLLLEEEREEGRGGDYQEHLKDFGIEKSLDTLVSDLSYGQRKLLQLLMAFFKPHQILLLDEPVAGVNKVVAAKIEDLLLKFKEQGETIVIIDHDMEFVRRLADKAVVMDEGRVLIEGTPSQVLKNKLVLEAYLGE